MTNEKITNAINELKALYKFYDVMCGDWSFCYTAIEALEKQIPKKPIGDLHSVPHYRCPVCGKNVKTYEDSIEIPYCCWCGQALLWEDEE